MKRRPGARTAQSVELDEVVTVTDLAAGGRAVARLADGRAAFLQRVFPGDRVRVRRGRVHPSYVEIEELELLEASPVRREPPCPDAGRCGGCDWMELPLEAQRRHKSDILRQSLVRVGRVPAERLPAGSPALGGEGLAYRRRVRLHLEDRRLGFFAGASRTLIEVERCHVCAPELWDAVATLRALLKDERQVRGEWLQDVLELEVRLLEGAARPAIELGLRAGARAPVHLLKRLAKFAYVQGDPTPERWPLTDDVYALLPPDGFVQVNQEVNARLLDEVLAIARSSGARRALDVYSGVGNFSLPLARLGIETLGIEVVADAVRHAERASKEQALPATFRAGQAAALLAGLAERGERFDLVVVDPPRAGAKGLGPLLAHLCDHTLVMISCDPVTLARDVAALEALGFELSKAVVFDMFPQTHHIETLAVLRKASPRSDS